jgi:hypothetical protein
MSRFHKLGWLLVILLVWFVVDTPLPLAAQSPTPTPTALKWSVPRRIPGLADDTDSPYLIADRNHTIHAFFSQWIEGDLAVFYTQRSTNGIWARPIDILLSPNKQQARVLGAFLDSNGMFHVIFYGGIAEGAEIYYSSAPAVEAARASAWSQPKLIGSAATAPASGALVGDDNGNLFVVYAGSRDGFGVYEAHSTDGGATWTDPKSVFLTDSRIQSVYGVQLCVGESGWVHAVWSVVDKTGQGRGIYYDRLNIQDKQWKFPISLADTPSGLGVHDPTIVEHRGRLYVGFYNADMGGHFVMRSSVDDGQSWTNPFAPFASHIGSNGAGSYVVDSNGQFHLFWGQRIPGSSGTNDIHGMWYSVWRGDDEWSVPQPIVSGPQTSQFDPSSPRAIVSQGNLILVTWRQDPGLAGNGVWYSYATLNAPELPVSALPTVMSNDVAVPTATATSVQLVATSTPSPALVASTLPGDTNSASNVRDPDVGLLVAALSVIALLFVVFMAQNLRRIR